MKKIWINNEALKEVLAENGIEILVNGKMEMYVSDEDAERIPELVDRLAPAASWDYGLEDEEYTYDVYFNDDNNTNNVGIHGTLEECKEWIKSNRHDESTYFGDYKGGIVSIYCEQTEKDVYQEPIQ